MARLLVKTKLAYATMPSRRCGLRRLGLRWGQISLQAGLAAVLALAACGTPRQGGSRERALEQEILGVDAATTASGFALIRHTSGGVVCSGSLIARDLVVTAKHCLFQATAGGDMPLNTDGFRIGFGTTQDSLVELSADRIAWVGMPGELSIQPAVDAGQDVALLHLSEPAIVNETVRDFAFSQPPTDQEPVQVAGFGLTNLQTGASGIRGVATGVVSGFDATSGILAISGPEVCFGDSGGPVLSADGRTIIGILGEVGDGDAGFCRAGVSFADTPANLEVQRLLAKECARVGGCGVSVASAGTGSAIDDAGVGGEGTNGGAPSTGGGIASGTAGVTIVSSGGTGTVGKNGASARSSCQTSPPLPGGTSPELLALLVGGVVATRRIVNRRALRAQTLPRHAFPRRKSKLFCGLMPHAPM